MRILHTSDWHVGKKLGRFSRLEETAEIIDEVVAIAEREEADLVLHSGDLFDRPLPPTDALRLALRSLVRLADRGRRPVVVVAGNHDSGDFFEALAPFLANWGIHLIGQIKPPGAGGVVEIDTASGERAMVAGLPFLREGRVVDFMEDAGRWYGQYAERIRRLTEAYAEHLITGAADAVSLLVAHFMVTGARVGGHGVPRGERELHMGEAYAAGEGAIPPSLGYVAMGHIHAPQPVPGANVPAEYAGSLLELDFGEAGEQKRVVVVEAEPGRPAAVRSVLLTAGRRLVRVAGTWEEIVAREDLAEAYLDLTVATEGPEPGLAERAREAFPYLVRVAASYERPDSEVAVRSHLPWHEVYAEYYQQERGEVASDELLAAFRDVEDEVASASA